MFERSGPPTVDDLPGSGADFLQQLRHFILDGPAIIASPHKISGPQTNDLALRLRKRGVSQIVLAGMATNLCVESHLRHLLEEGFEVVVVRDATGRATARRRRRVPCGPDELQLPRPRRLDDRRGSLASSRRRLTPRRAKGEGGRLGALHKTQDRYIPHREGKRSVSSDLVSSAGVSLPAETAALVGDLGAITCNIQEPSVAAPQLRPGTFHHDGAWTSVTGPPASAGSRRRPTGGPVSLMVNAKAPTAARRLSSAQCQWREATCLLFAMTMRWQARLPVRRCRRPSADRHQADAERLQRLGPLIQPGVRHGPGSSSPHDGQEGRPDHGIAAARTASRR